MQVWIGTSGYSYPDWVGSFYPAQTRPQRMLAYYCRAFPIVELNFTFYRPPTPSMLDRLAGQTPTPFQFLVKLPRALSHEEDRKELPGFCRALDALKRRGQLSGALCQLPQSAHRSRSHTAWIERLAAELSDFHLAVEFRHSSWSVPEVPAWLNQVRADLVSVDVPNLPRLYPRGLVQSGRRIYVRLHSREAANWYAGGADRYDYDYQDAEMMEWANALAEHEAQAELAYILFNNCAGGQAAENASRMRDLMAKFGDIFQIVAAPPLEDPTQPSLFG
jgi:uncharacterized protein YecE (DUF72 family)